MKNHGSSAIREEKMKQGGEGGEGGEGGVGSEGGESGVGSEGGESGVGNGEESAPVVEYYCGVGKFRPNWLQVFRSPYFFSFILCCDILFSGALSTGELKIIVLFCFQLFIFFTFWSWF